MSLLSNQNRASGQFNIPFWKFEPQQDSKNKLTIRPAKSTKSDLDNGKHSTLFFRLQKGQRRLIRLGICQVWSGSFLTHIPSWWLFGDAAYILNAKNLAPLSISIFSGSKLITSNFSIIQMMCPCRKTILVTNSNAWECLGVQRRIFGEKFQNIDFLT